MPKPQRVGHWRPVRRRLFNARENLTSTSHHGQDDIGSHCCGQPVVRLAPRCVTPRGFSAASAPGGSQTAQNRRRAVHAPVGRRNARNRLYGPLRGVSGDPAIPAPGPTWIQSGPTDMTGLSAVMCNITTVSPPDPLPAQTYGQARRVHEQSGHLSDTVSDPAARPRRLVSGRRQRLLRGGHPSTLLRVPTHTDATTAPRARRTDPRAGLRPLIWGFAAAPPQDEQAEAPPAAPQPDPASGSSRSLRWTATAGSAYSERVSSADRSQAMACLVGESGARAGAVTAVERPHVTGGCFGSSRPRGSGLRRAARLGAAAGLPGSPLPGAPAAQTSM